MTVAEIEQELKQLSHMPPWGRKQSDEWDLLTRFIYTTPKYLDFCNELQQKNNRNDFEDWKNYAIHRWFNYWSAKGVEQIFCESENVIANKNEKDKLVDFSIQNISFDHKTSVFPRGFNKNLVYAKQHPKELIEWFYKEQSGEGRFHTHNRLFLVLHKNDGKHWELRKELLWLKPIIENYIENFNSKNLLEFSFQENKKTVADIIWAIA